MSSKPPGLTLTRAEIVEKLQAGQIRIQTVPHGQLPQQGGGQQPRLIRLVNSAAPSSTTGMRLVQMVSTAAPTATGSTPLKLVHTVAPSLSSPHTTRTIKIGSPRPPVAVSRPAATPFKPQEQGTSTLSSSLPSPQGSDQGARPGKRADLDFESFSDSKRRKTDKGGKGLRHFSMKVCEKVKAKGTTSYNEVADELVAELTDPRCQSPSDQQYDQKNIRRRVYDALNVLMAMNIISKEKKEIRWLGLPTNSVQEATGLETEKAKRIESIKAKTDHIQELIVQQIAFKKLVERNKEAEKKSRRPTPNSVIEIPFIIVSTNNKTVIECAISEDKKEYLFDFDNTFEIHDDMFVLKKMNMAMGLEKEGGGQVSAEDLARARSMVPRALEPYVAQLAQHGPGRCTLPQVSSPRLPAVKDDPDSLEMFQHSAMSLDQVGKSPVLRPHLGAQEDEEEADSPGVGAMLPWRRAAAAPGVPHGARLKRKLLSALQEAVSELQYDQRSDHTTPIPSNELSGRLLNVLEALFVHGLKDTFLGRLSARFQDSSSASPRLPDPSFWTFCLVFSHRAVIGQLEAQSQLASEVGRCRAWLRLALNDGLLASYLAAMAKDQVSLTVHYEKFAFLRDADMRDLLLTYLTGVECYTFSLSTNVSLLNRWQAGPLTLAGVWAPSASSVVEGALDVAAEMVEEEPPAPAFSRTLAQPIGSDPTSYLRHGLLNEDEALALILASTPITFSPNTLPTNPSPLPASPSPSSPSPEPVSRSTTVSPTLHWDATNSCLLAELSTRGPASLEEELRGEVYPAEGKGEGEEDEGQASVVRGEDVEDPPSLCWDSAGMSDGISLRPEDDTELALDDGKNSPRESFDIDQRDIPVEKLTPTENLQQEQGRREMSRSSSESSVASCSCSSAGPDPSCVHCSDHQPRPKLQLLAETPEQGTDLISLQSRRRQKMGQLGLGFREPPVVRVPGLSLEQGILLAASLDCLPQECGLESQDWRCADCGAAIGAIFGQWRVCGLTSRYYCSECHTGQTGTIPARLLYNWDIVPRPIAVSSSKFLDHIASKPLLNMSTFNPSLARVAPALEEAGRLRKQLTYLAAYLAACSRAQAEGVKVALAEAVWPRDYLYTDTDTYSLQDMHQLHRGELRTTLRAGVKLCTNHVFSCLVCSGRGFICEVCSDRRPVYPFHLETTSQCQECGTVFHLACAAALPSCPRCERLAARGLRELVTSSKLARETREGV